MCDCMHSDAIWCLLASLKVQGVKEDYSFSECIGGCSCPCHSELASDEWEEMQVEQEYIPPVVFHEFSKMPNMRKCDSCGMWFAGPEHSQHKRADKAKRKAS